MKVLVICATLFMCYTFTAGKTHYPFKGCYKDNSQRDMKEGVFVQHNSHKFCANRCKEKGYAYFGVQNAQDCWCGHSYNNDKVKHARVKYSECNKVCTGNPNEHCGSDWRMAVYATYSLDKNFIACEHQGTKTLQCPSGSVIKVNSAYYGRQSSTECGNENTVCVADGSEKVIIDLCHGKQSCVVNPENSVFGDPCHGTVKYVDVDYNCVGGKLPGQTCPIEEGFCVKSDGGDQNSGVIKLDNIDGDSSEQQQKCLKKCKETAHATGCEVIWDQNNRGCYAHTEPIARGNGASNHMCWVFSKCKGKPFAKVHEKFQLLTEEVAQLNENNADLEKQNQQLQADVKELQSKNTHLENAVEELEKHFEEDIAEIKEENTSDHCPLGMENNFISDSQITASSHWSSDYTPKKGRLNSVSDETGRAAWVPSSSNHIGGWIQVDLLQPTTVTGLITQGRGDNANGIQYTKTYNVYYGNSPSNINAILDSNGKVKVFSGNFDRNTKVVNFFDTPVKARYIRVVAQSYSNHVALRMELLSC